MTFQANTPIWWIQLDIGSFLRVTQDMTTQQIGCYILLRLYLTTNEYLPQSKSRLRQICKNASTLEISSVLKFFSLSNEGKYFDDELMQLKNKVKKKSNARSEAGKLGAEKRWKKSNQQLTELNQPQLQSINH